MWIQISPGFLKLVYTILMRESLEWEAYEHDWFPKTTHWFWIIGGATAVLMLVAILFNNFLFAILLLVGGL